MTLCSVVVQKILCAASLVCLAVRLRVTPVIGFGIRENFLPSEIGREKVSEDM